MNVTDAILSRRSVRAFLEKPVPLATLEHLVHTAARSPSGGNLQPWSVDIVLGRRLEELKILMQERIDRCAQDEQLDVAIYPEPLAEPYRTRRREIGEAMYRTLQIDRADKEGRRQWFNRNFACFGAPALLFVQIERGMGKPQWADIGMFVQTLMLLCVEAGLATCPQECWALFPRTVGSFLGSDPDLILFCGISVGYEDTGHAVAGLQSTRALPHEFMRTHID